MTAIEHGGTRGADNPHRVDPVVIEYGTRLVSLQSGTAAQRELARVIDRAMDLAADAGRASEIDETELGLSRFAAAVRGVDAVESLLSAVSASRARLIADAYAHAHEHLTDPNRSPGDEVRHADGTIDRAVSRRQITAAALSTVLHISAGAASAMVEESVRFTRHMPHTMRLLASGQLTTFHQYLVRTAIKDLSRDQCERFDETFTQRPLTGAYYGPGQDRAVGGLVARRLMMLKWLSGRAVRR